MTEELIKWIVATPAHRFLGDIAGWCVPAVQSIHIATISILLTFVGLIALRLIGFGRGGMPLQKLMRGFLPWIWSAFAVLLVSGGVLIVTEPDRELTNLIFQVKMVLVLLLASLVWAAQRSVAKTPERWATATPMVGRAIGAASLLLLVTIVTAGRWIAYY